MLTNIVKPLKSLSKEIFLGAPLYSVSKLAESKDGIPVLNIKDIMNDQILKENLKIFSLDNFRNALHYMVYPNDVIITCRGTQLKIVMIPKTIERMLITSNLIAIRPNEEIIPEFLVAYLNTKKGRKKLTANTASSTMQIVLNVSNLGDIEIPVPPMDLQKKIIDLIGSTEEQYQLNIKIADTYKTISNQLLEDMLGL